MRIGPNPVGTVSALIALAGLANTSNTQAAIVVSSLSNLDIPPGEATAVDFDGDGSFDFSFFYDNSRVLVQSINGINTVKYDENFGTIRNYAAGAQIALSQVSATFVGEFVPLAAPIYAGFEFQIGGSTHLGWFQMDNVEGDLALVRIISAAWQSTPGASLNAGAVPELPTTPLVFGTVAGLAVWWLRRPTQPGHGSP